MGLLSLTAYAARTAKGVGNSEWKYRPVTYFPERSSAFLVFDSIHMDHLKIIRVNSFMLFTRLWNPPVPQLESKYKLIEARIDNPAGTKKHGCVI